MKRPVFDVPTRARLAAAKLAARRAASGDDGRSAFSRSSRGAVEFRDHVPYAPGDDLRRLDWNLYGRLDQLFIRRFSGETKIENVFLLDGSASMDLGEPSKSVFARRLAAALALSALAAGREVRIGSIAERLEVHPRVFSGPKDENSVIDALEALPDPSGVARFAAARGLFKPGAHLRVVAVLSDFCAENVLEDLHPARAERRVETALFAIHAGEERSPSAAHAATLFDPENGERLAVSPTPEVCELYAEQFAAWIESLHTRSAALGARFEALTSEEAFDETAIKLIRRGAFA